MPRRPAPRSGRSRLLPRGVRSLSGSDPSPAGGIARVLYGETGPTLRGSLCLPLRTSPRGGAGTPSSNTVNWRCSRCRQRCLLCKGTYSVLPRYAFPFLVSCCFFSEPPLRRLTYVFACFRSSRPGPLGNRCSYEGRGASGSSSGGKRACLPTPRSSCRCGVLKWRTSAFAVST